MGFLSLGWVRVIAVAAVLAGAFWAGSTWTGRAYRAEIEQMNAANAKALAEAESAARKREGELQSAARLAAIESARRVNELEKRAAAAAAAGRGLRNELAAANSRPGSCPAPASPVDDATLLRDMLVDLDFMAGVFARSAEGNAARLRSLQEHIEAVSGGRE